MKVLLIGIKFDYSWYKLINYVNSVICTATCRFFLYPLCINLEILYFLRILLHGKLLLNNIDEFTSYKLQLLESYCINNFYHFIRYKLISDIINTFHNCS